MTHTCGLFIKEFPNTTWCSLQNKLSFFSFFSPAVWRSWTFSKSSRSGSFLYNSSFYSSLFFHILLYMVSRSQAMLLMLCLEIFSAKCLMSLLISSDKFYNSWKTRTLSSQVLCHPVTRITFPLGSNNVVFIAFWVLTRVPISSMQLKILPASVHYSAPCALVFVTVAPHFSVPRLVLAQTI